MSLLTRFLNMFRSKALEQEFNDELRFHVEERIARHLEQGMNQADAERAAYGQFGSVERAKREMREVRMMNRHFVGGLIAGLLLAGIPAGLLWIRARHTPPPARQDSAFAPQALRGLSTNSPAPAEASTICGVDVPAPSALPPSGTGPVVYFLAPCFERQGNRSRVEPTTYLHDIHLQPSWPSRGRWVPYDGSAEKAIREDFQRLWSNHALNDLSVDIRDYRFSNGVIGKLVTYNITERN